MGGQKALAFFVYVSFVMLISICLIKYCCGYLFGSLNLTKAKALNSRSTAELSKESDSAFENLLLHSLRALDCFQRGKR